MFTSVCVPLVFVESSVVPSVLCLPNRARLFQSQVPGFIFNSAHADARELNKLSTNEDNTPPTTGPEFGPGTTSFRSLNAFSKAHHFQKILKAALNKS